VHYYRAAPKLQWHRAVRLRYNSRNNSYVAGKIPP
jgi:hypothetical protein